MLRDALGPLVADVVAGEVQEDVVKRGVADVEAGDIAGDRKSVE